MNELIFLVEEVSIVPVIEAIVRGIVPEDIAVRIIPHQGKSDLQKSIPRKLRGWLNPKAHFVIVHDQDSHDCKKLKKLLQKLCPKDKLSRIIVRIVCTELESWFFGDLEAVKRAYPKKRIRNVLVQQSFRNTDKIRNAADELMKIVPEYQKVSGARVISQHLDIARNVSSSFQFFVSGIEKLVANMQSEP